MADTQFISHAQVVPTPVVVPRRGTGLFNALMTVLTVLVAAATGGLVLLKIQAEKDLAAAQEQLASIQQNLEIPSIKQAADLQRRINLAKSALASHLYASQAFNFVEAHTLDSVIFISFQFGDGKISAKAVAPGFLVFAEQIKHYRSIPNMASFSFSTPELDEKGRVKFGLEIKLSDQLLHEKSLSGINTVPPEAVLPEPLPPPPPVSPASKTNKTKTPKTQ